MSQSSQGRGGRRSWRSSSCDVLAINAKNSVLSVSALVRLKSNFRRAYVPGMGLQGTGGKPLFNANLWLEEVHHLAPDSLLQYWPYGKQEQQRASLLSEEGKLESKQMEEGEREEEQRRCGNALGLALDAWNLEDVSERESEGRQSQQSEQQLQQQSQQEQGRLQLQWSLQGHEQQQGLSLRESEESAESWQSQSLAPLGSLSLPQSNLGELKYGEIKDAKDAAHMVALSLVKGFGSSSKADEQASSVSSSLAAEAASSSKQQQEAAIITAVAPVATFPHAAIATPFDVAAPAVAPAAVAAQQQHQLVDAVMAFPVFGNAVQAIVWRMRE